MIISKDKLKKSNTLSVTAGAKSPVTIVDGKAYGSNSSPAVLKRTSKFFTRKNISTPTRTSDPNVMALEVLNAMGVSVVSETPYTDENFSLLRVQTDTEIINNENILNGATFDKPISPTDLKDKFKNNQDPIYVLDDPLSISAQNMRNHIVEEVQNPSVIDITSQICITNAVNPDTALKYFKVPNMIDRPALFIGSPTLVENPAYKEQSMAVHDTRPGISQAEGNHPNISQAEGNHPTVINTRNVFVYTGG